MIALFLLQIAYVVSRRLIPFTSVPYYLMIMIKGLVFNIKGACKHSGQCCQSIMLYDSQKPIQSLSVWDQYLKQYPDYDSFVPNHKCGKIESFDCRCLTDEHMCSRYESRPAICRQYPTSFFYEHGFIYDSCGYYVEKNHQYFKWLFTSIKDQLNVFSKLNG